MIANTATTLGIIDESTFNSKLKGKTKLEMYNQSTTQIPFGSKCIRS